jgi:hypothetical protein
MEVDDGEKESGARARRRKREPSRGAEAETESAHLRKAPRRLGARDRSTEQQKGIAKVAALFAHLRECRRKHLWTQGAALKGGELVIALNAARREYRAATFVRFADSQHLAIEVTWRDSQEDGSTQEWHPFPSSVAAVAAPTNNAVRSAIATATHERMYDDWGHCDGSERPPAPIMREVAAYAQRVVGGADEEAPTSEVRALFAVLSADATGEVPPELFNEPPRVLSGGDGTNAGLMMLEARWRSEACDEERPPYALGSSVLQPGPPVLEMLDCISDKFLEKLPPGVLPTSAMETAADVATAMENSKFYDVIIPNTATGGYFDPETGELVDITGHRGSHQPLRITYSLPHAPQIDFKDLQKEGAYINRLSGDDSSTLNPLFAYTQSGREASNYCARPMSAEVFALSLLVWVEAWGYLGTVSRAQPVRAVPLLL